MCDLCKGAIKRSNENKILGFVNFNTKKVAYMLQLPRLLQITFSSCDSTPTLKCCAFQCLKNPLQIRYLTQQSHFEPTGFIFIYMYSAECNDYSIFRTHWNYFLQYTRPIIHTAESLLVHKYAFYLCYFIVWYQRDDIIYPFGSKIFNVLSIK